MTEKPTYEELEKRVQELEQAESMSKQAEEQLRNIFENTTNLFYSHTADHQITYISPQVEHILGYTVEEAMIKWTEFASDDPINEIGFQNTIKAIETGERQPTYELELIRKDGKKIIVEVRESPIVKNGKTVAMVGSLADITERKQAIEELRKSENNYKALAENPNSIVMRFDPKGNIIFVNQYACNLFGYSFKEMMGKKSTDLIHPGIQDDGQSAEDLFAKLLNHPERYQTNENANLTKDGKRLWISWANTPTYDESGQLTSLICTGFDTTDKKQMETQLQQAQKMESIGTLAGGIAHDFNNILSPILGYTEMLLMDVPEDGPFKKNLNQIYTSALRARSLVKQILTFSRQGSSELMLMKMQTVVKEALKLIRSTIPTTIEIKQDINPDCGVIKADPTQIHQIVMNLATNAYHAMEETGGELKVSLKQVELGEYDIMTPDMTPGTYACLTVADTGKGMDKNLTDKIFDPFFTTKAIGKGTGMGLSVVHGIVTAMGGAIHVYSEPGKGTEFHVYLPVEKTLSHEQATVSKAQIKGGTEHILLVDDEQAILNMEKQMLERLGYQVTSRLSSVEALEAFRDSPDKFDLVITDMAMPNMPGDKLSVELTKIRSDIPVLLCTGFSETMSEEKATSLGIKGFILKPIVMKDLDQKIREVLDK
ncbi:PAS domain S-box protein [Desulfobacula sp.]|uniref:PAS domain-containing hybrid sensor histidine kinase/response regulator n=1 Tax=Desulfobacula sp. TaxID=2593537 RepID=UPI001ED53813|nr:PAS domain S-box protein [Desulfobacula sp.]